MIFINYLGNAETWNKISKNEIIQFDARNVQVPAVASIEDFPV